MRSSPPPLFPSWSQHHPLSSQVTASPRPTLPPTVYSQHSSQGEPVRDPPESRHLPLLKTLCSISLGGEAKPLPHLRKLHHVTPTSAPSWAPSALLPCSASALGGSLRILLLTMFLACLEYKPLADRGFCPPFHCCTPSVDSSVWHTACPQYTLRQ